MTMTTIRIIRVTSSQPPSKITINTIINNNHNDNYDNDCDYDNVHYNVE